MSVSRALARPTSLAAAVTSVVTLAGVVTAVPAVAGPSPATAAPTALTAVSAPTKVKPRKVEPEQTSYAHQQLTWTPCDGGDARLKNWLTCATIKVPLDWRTPEDGRTLDVVLSKAGTGTEVLFTNPGGPGLPGLTTPGYLYALRPPLRSRYTIVGMDPRGVSINGGTKLNCEFEAPDTQPDSQDTSPEARQIWRTAVKSIADNCARNPLVPYINTTQTTYDMDLVRALFQRPKMSYVGYSYGTFLGAAYATNFPDKADRVVLDSNTQWDDLPQAWVVQPMGFQRQYSRVFVPWVSRWTSTPAKKVTPEYVDGFLRDLRARAATKGLGTVIDDAIVQALYSPNSWPGSFTDLVVTEMLLRRPETFYPKKDVDALVADALERFPGMDEALLRRYIQTIVDLMDALAHLPMPARVPAVVHAAHPQKPSSLRSTGMMVPFEGLPTSAVMCSEKGWHSAHWWEKLSEDITPGAWLTGYQSAYQLCSYWHAPSYAPKVRAKRPGVPVLQVQAEFDGPTAYELSVINAARNPMARTIRVQDDPQHGQYALRGNSCVDTLVDRYLLDGVLPANTTCAGVPLPYEHAVVPVAGPIDSGAPARPAKRVVRDPASARALEQLISGNTLR